MKKGFRFSIQLIFFFFNAVTTPVLCQDAAKALHFENTNSSIDGDFVYCGSSNYGLSTKITVAAWVRWTAPPAVSLLSALLGNDASAANIVSMEKHNATDQGQFWLQHNTTNTSFEWAVTGSSRTVLESTTAPAVNKWYYVVGVYDGNASTSMELYVDGVLEASAANAANHGNITAYSNVHRLNMGRSPSGTQLFTGDLDEVRIWKRALTQDEIRAQMVSATTIDPTSLVSYWNMNEGTGTTVHDSVGTADGKFYTGLASANFSLFAPAKSIVDLTRGWGTSSNGMWAGLPLKTVSGAGVDETNTIVSNTSTQLNVQYGFGGSSPNNRTTPVYAGFSNASMFGIENAAETSQWVASTAFVGNSSGYVTTQTPMSIGQTVTVTLTSTPSAVNNLSMWKAGSASGSHITLGEIFPAGIAARTNLLWGMVHWGSVTATLVFNYSAVTNIADPSKVKLLSRASDASPWVEVAVTSRNDAAKTLTVAGVSPSGSIDGIGSSAGIPVGLSYSMSQGGTGAGTAVVVSAPSTVTYSIGIGSSPMPVELTSFTADRKGSMIQLQWKTATEHDNAGFEVQRRSAGNPVTADDAWQSLQFIQGAGSSNAPQEYSFYDRNVASGQYTYRLKQIDRNGAFEYSKTVEVAASALPQEFSLAQNYPNPFNPSTTIAYVVPADDPVTLTLYDVTGRELAILVNEHQTAGHHHVVFNAATYASGVYVYVLRSAHKTASRKLAITK